MNSSLRIAMNAPHAEPPVRIELTTYRLQGGCSTTELQGRIYVLTTDPEILQTCVVRPHRLVRERRRHINASP